MPKLNKYASPKSIYEPKCIQKFVSCSHNPVTLNRNTIFPSSLSNPNHHKVNHDPKHNFTNQYHPKVGSVNLSKNDITIRNRKYNMPLTSSKVPTLKMPLKRNSSVMTKVSGQMGRGSVGKTSFGSVGKQINNKRS